MGRPLTPLCPLWWVWCGGGGRVAHLAVLPVPTEYEVVGRYQWTAGEWRINNKYT